MANYLNQFQRFSEGVSRSLQQGAEGLSRGMLKAAELDAREEKYRLDQVIKQKKEVNEKLYGEHFSNMYDWMAQDLRAQRDYFDNEFKEGRLNSTQLTSASKVLQAVTKQYQNATSNYEGSPDDDPLQASRYGMLNALTEMEKGNNPWDEVDQAPVDSYDLLVADVANRYTVLQKGKSENEVYLGGRMDPTTGKWMVKFGVPGEPDTHIELDRKTFLANLEGGNAYAPSNGFKDINIPTIRELSSESQVKNFVGDDEDGPATYFRTMITGSGKAHRRFKKAVFDEMAPEIFQEDELEQMRSLFLGEAIPIEYDRKNNTLVYENVDPRFEKMIRLGLDRFVSDYGEVNQPTSTDSDRYPNENKVFAEQWNEEEAMKAYENIPKTWQQRALETLGLPVPSGFRADTDVMRNIKDMVAVDPFELDAGSGKFVHAVAQDLEGRLIAKIVAEVEQPLTEAQMLAGMPPTTAQSTYYEVLPEALYNNAYKEIGMSLNPKTADAKADGEKYLYDKYIKPFAGSSSTASMETSPAASVDEEPTPVSPPRKRDPIYMEPGRLPFENKPVPEYYDPETYMGDVALITRLQNAYEDEYDSLSMYNWLKEHPGQIAPFISEIDKGNIPYWFDGDLIFEKKE